MALEIKNLHVTLKEQDKEILKGISLDVDAGKTVVLMGPNGSGKTTLASTVMGNPQFAVSNTASTVTLDGQDLLSLTPDKRSLAGLFLSFQHPPAVPGVTVSSFLHAAMNAKQQQDSGKKITIIDAKKHLRYLCEELAIDTAFLERPLHDGFSGGEKKKLEMLQLALLRPKYAILDETDSGLDIDALKLVCKVVQLCQEKFNLGVLIITHYKRILDHLTPDTVHIMQQGKIIETGDKALVDKLEAQGYKWLQKE